jgi:GNAT superfamily N-acetyltransferase
MAAAAITSRVDVHRDSLLKLWKENFDDPRMADVADGRFDWLYRKNPLGPTRTWLAVDTAGNGVIGCASVFPSNRSIGGRMVRTGVAVDFAVDREHRTAGVALVLQRAVTSDSRRAGFDCLIGKPNRKALPIFDRVGYRPVGDAQDWVKFIGAGAELPEPSQAPSYAETIVSAADARFDELWKAGRSHYEIVGEKTAAFLNWRYSTFKEENYRFYCLFHRDDRRLMGYLCFSAAQKTVFIADIFCEDPRGPIIDNLLLGLACRAKMEGQEWIGLSYLGAPWFEDRLARLGFTHGKHRRQLLAYVAPGLPAQFCKEILTKNNWFLFGGEMDLF